MRLVKKGLRILKNSIAGYAAHNCLSLSASISYYAMFSFFPLLLLTLSMFATFAGSSEVAMKRMAGLVATLTPVGSGMVMGWVESIAGTKPLAWGIGVVALVWGARHVFQTLAMSASIIWGRKGWMDVLLRQLVSLLLVGFAALMLLASLFLPGLIDRLQWEANFPLGNALIAGVIVIPYLISFITFTAIYLLTSPRSVPKRNVFISAAVVSLTWELSKNAFLGYIRMTQFTSAYGSIGGIIVLMTWIYCSSAIVLWGMELVAASYEKPVEHPHIKTRTGVLIIE